ncbi:YdeI/OmpD-associated family protein [Tahibacter sp. P2K]|uniref:YdeI/OmpD-associated family protein n=2 Tax=Tahibacter harae TaxID=2963937 RepID=A0ABT1QTQ6_9GAMM|nr:YdeI/OmpD-associated family protein [Tahibacter harae]
MDAEYFRTPDEFRRWLQRHHASATELWVGYHKAGTGEPSMTWPQSVDQALCYGWIDGRRQRVDEQRYRIRFTPRKPGSIWSTVNIRRMGELEKAGLVQPAGRAAFAARRAEKTAVYSYEVRREALEPAQRARLDQHPAAAAFFDAQNASYRRACCNWVSGAKQESTRERRLDSLIAHCERGETSPQFTRR